MGTRTRMSSEDLPIPRPPHTANLPQKDQILVDEAALESFPASDPPAWTATHAGAPAAGPPKIDTPRELRQKLRADVGRLVELIDGTNGRSRQGVHRLQAAAEIVTSELLDAGRHVVRIPVPSRPGVETMEAAIRGAEEGAELVIGARYDTNPSAAAVLLSLARVLSHRRFVHTVRLVAFADDLGSEAYAKRLREQAISLHGMLSLHSVGFLTDRDLSGSLLTRMIPSWQGTFVAFVGDGASRALTAETRRAFSLGTRLEARAYTLPSVFPLLLSSEGRSFRRAGFPAALVTDTGPLRNLRQPRGKDLLPMLNYDAMADLVFGLAAVVARLAGDERA